MRLPGQRAGDPDGSPVEKGYQLRVEACGLVFLIPELMVLFVGPAGCQRAVYQDNPPLHDLDRIGRGRHEFLQHRFHERHQGCQVTGNGGL
jgi:hypothetical protein